ncbi:helix-turn-helix domain-containing protein [Sporolactobacillus vineae]|uniref:helix-turn-helix domain-containing protein n=1 Tax=Sporolactobacillus vineae TaxID=444463 RepID=UPI00028A0EA9|nr:helix-turn-helix domain-containing protein [Sporolactobacillus vineae]
MDIQKLVQHYPGTVMKREPFHPDRHMFYFYERPYYIGIPSRSLSESERRLLSLLLDQETPPVYSERARCWYGLLIEGKPLSQPDPGKRISIIQFHLTKRLEQSDLKEWRAALEAFFGVQTDFIYLSEHDGLIVEQDQFIEEASLKAIANTLRNDFSVKTCFQIGLRYPLSPQLRAAYLEEKKLFDQRMDQAESREVTTVEHAFFDFLKPLAGKWVVLNELSDLISAEKSWRPIIRAIWENQGNLSMAAKHLFMHRNTLLNRIDKFYEITGISLKRMDGLTMAYLSTL